MKLFFHYCSFGFSNCYILGSESSDLSKPAAAIIIDPGNMDNAILKTIENNNFVLKAVFVTHDHLGHIKGLRTLKRIYNAEVFAVKEIVMDQKTNIIKDDEVINIDDLQIKAISIPGHSADSVVYQVDSMLFTGDVLTAGLVGSTASAYGAATQMNKLRSRLLSLPGDYIVLPGHGPPTTLEAERRFNLGITEYDQGKNRKRVFKIDEVL